MQKAKLQSKEQRKEYSATDLREYGKKENTER